MSRYLALAVVSAAVLGYEVLLVRLFAIVQWHHFAFMAISVALLGFGISGTLLAIWQDQVKPRFEVIFAASAVLFAATAPLGFLLAQMLPFNALAVVWEPGQLLYLPIMYLLLVVPFLCGATCIGLSFICFDGSPGRIYAFNLIGSAVGALGIVGVLFAIMPQDALRLVAILGLLSAAIIGVCGKVIRRAVVVTGFGIFAAIIWAALPPSWFELKISEYKALSSALNITGTKVLGQRSGPLGLLTVVESPDVPFRYVPGLSLNAAALPPDQLGVFTDGGAMTALTRFTGLRQQLAYLDHTTDALAYHLTERPAALILGAGGGRSVLQAIYHQARHIDAVELDANMVRLLQHDYEHETGNIYARPEVQVHVSEARGFIASATRRWDLIQLPLFAASGGGLHGLSETYVYTVEAFTEYIGHLTPDGWLSITRSLELPPRGTLKLFATALETLRRMGSAAPEQQLLLIRGLNTTTLLMKNGVITTEEIARARNFTQSRSFDLGFHPQMTDSEANRYNILDAPYFYRGAKALAGPERQDFISGYKFDIAPVTDERPYFFDFLKWRHLPELLAIQRSGGTGLLELGSLILVGTLVQATILSAVLILIPLWVRRRSLAGSPLLWRVAAYFLALGLAFLFVEIAFIQKFILFLSHPLYAVAVVLAGFLLFSGIGSGLSPVIADWLDNRRPKHSGRRLRLTAIHLAVAGIVCVSLIYVFVLSAVFDALLSLNDAGKVAVSLVLIAPLALFMGMPFPLGLARVRSEAPALVPWAWGVNGCASVLSAMLATLIAMEFGFSVVIAIAAGLYLCAAAVLGRTS